MKRTFLSFGQHVCSASTECNGLCAVPILLIFTFQCSPVFRKGLVLAPAFLVLPLHKVECIYRYDCPPPSLGCMVATPFCGFVYKCWLLAVVHAVYIENILVFSHLWFQNEIFLWSLSSQLEWTSERFLYAPVTCDLVWVCVCMHASGTTWWWYYCYHSDVIKQGYITCFKAFYLREYLIVNFPQRSTPAIYKGKPKHW